MLYFNVRKTIIIYFNVRKTIIIYFNVCKTIKIYFKNYVFYNICFKNLYFQPEMELHVQFVGLSFNFFLKDYVYFVRIF